MEKKSYKKKMDESFDFTPKRGKADPNELEVTGISRSGRVRKKSSKLTDFESLDELEMRGTTKKKDRLIISTQEASVSPVLTANAQRSSKKEKFQIPKEELISDEELLSSAADEFSSPKHQSQAHDSTMTPFSEESEADLSFPPNEDSSLDSIGSELEDLEEPDLEEPEGFQAIADDEYNQQQVHQQQQSLYMMEKSNKKKLVIKDGKIVARDKSPRKNKGQPRITAYMLWAKEIRQEILRKNPNLDFSQTSKKLGELWATVPLHEKYIWKRRANRLSVKTAAVGGGSASPRQSSQMDVSSGGSGGGVKKIKSPPSKKLLNKPSLPPQATTTVGIAGVNNLQTAVSPVEPKGTAKGIVVDASVYKPVPTTPIDVAAHLRLLGESLMIIGERLTESEGQIAVSGSYSLLMDSLLCALVPLICLTQQVPQLNVIPQEQLSQLMDNIAYIMPGL